MDNLRYPVKVTSEKRIRIQAFGNFEVYLDGQPLRFKYDKTKEVLAYLVDRKRAMCSHGELMAVLWEDETHKSYFSNIRADLINTLKKQGVSNIISKHRGYLGIVMNEVSCVFFDWLNGIPTGLNAYRSEYMIQYSWSELSNLLFY